MPQRIPQVQVHRAVLPEELCLWPKRLLRPRDRDLPSQYVLRCGISLLPSIGELVGVLSEWPEMCANLV